MRIVSFAPSTRKLRPSASLEMDPYLAKLCLSGKLQEPARMMWSARSQGLRVSILIAFSERWVYPDRQSISLTRYVVDRRTTELLVSRNLRRAPLTWRANWRLLHLSLFFH